jgi:putative component of toxin-antitoxin plasmid stabilization module
MLIAEIFDLRRQNQYLNNEFQIRKDYLILQAPHMRITMSTKSKKTRKIQKTKGLEVNTEAVRILRTLRDEEAFYFYEQIGKTTGERAKSLCDFLEKVKSVKLESLVFHLERKDFENWISRTLDDSKLARRMSRIVSSNDADVRVKIQAVIENRIKELRGTSVALLVNQDVTVVPSAAS